MQSLEIWRFYVISFNNQFVNFKWLRKCLWLKLDWFSCQAKTVIKVISRLPKFYCFHLNECVCTHFLLLLKKLILDILIFIWAKQLNLTKHPVIDSRHFQHIKNFNFSSQGARSNTNVMRNKLIFYYILSSQIYSKS